MYAVRALGIVQTYDPSHRGVDKPRPVRRGPSGGVGDVLDNWTGHDIESRLLCITQYRDKGHGRALANRLAADKSRSRGSLEMPLRIDLPAFLLDIVTDGR